MLRRLRQTLFRKSSADVGAPVPTVASGLEPGGVSVLPQQLLGDNGPTNDPTKAVSFNLVEHVRELLGQLSYVDRCNVTGLDPDAPHEVTTAAGPGGGYYPIRHSRTDSIPPPEAQSRSADTSAGPQGGMPHVVSDELLARRLFAEEQRKVASIIATLKSDEQLARSIAGSQNESDIDVSEHAPLLPERSYAQVVTSRKSRPIRGKTAAAARPIRTDGGRFSVFADQSLEDGPTPTAMPPVPTPLNACSTQDARHASVQWQ